MSHKAVLIKYKNKQKTYLNSLQVEYKILHAEH